MVSTVACPIRLSRSPVQYRSAPPVLAQHQAEVLHDWLDEDLSVV